MAGLQPVVVFWTGWGIHVTVLLSFAVQVALLLLSDIRRRKDCALLKGFIWLAYTLADTTAVYALGHMSVVCRSPEHHLMALWAPLLLVHLGGQDNITAYAMEDNRLWLRHLQTFVLQVGAAGYVLYASSILFHPSKVRSAAILMFLVGVLKYGERIWALKRANSCASSILSATSYDKVSVSRTAGESNLARAITSWNGHQIVAYSLLDVPKQMFEGPTSYVQIKNVDDKVHEAKYMLRVVEMQLSMMYDLLYTKAAVVHTWYGLSSRVLISLPSTVTALALLFRSSLSHGDKDAAGRYYYKKVDIVVTDVLLVGAVVLETMSVLRAIFSKWTAVLLYGRGWSTIGDVVFLGVEGSVVTEKKEALVGSGSYWSGRMRQHSLFKLLHQHYGNYSRGSKMAKRMGVEDWWDSNVYSWSTEVTELTITKVLELGSTTEDITKSQGMNAVRRHMNNEQLAAWIWMEESKLEERILVWHIATHVYIWWYKHYVANLWNTDGATLAAREATEALANYMFFLLAARPYMLPYPVSRQAYVQLCHDAVTHLRSYSIMGLVLAILNQKEALMNGTPLEQGTGPQRNNTGIDGAQPQPCSMNNTLDRGCQLAAKLIHITAMVKESTMVKRSGKKQREQRQKIVDGKKDMIAEQAETFSCKVILNMVLEVWAEMLCYTAYFCNENYHAKHLTNGGEIMTIITLMMIYMKNGLICKNASTSGTAASPSSQGAGATATDTATTIDTDTNTSGTAASPSSQGTEATATAANTDIHSVV